MFCNHFLFQDHEAENVANECCALALVLLITFLHSTEYFQMFTAKASYYIYFETKKIYFCDFLKISNWCDDKEPLLVNHLIKSQKYL